MNQVKTYEQRIRDIREKFQQGKTKDEVESSLEAVEQGTPPGWTNWEKAFGNWMGNY